MSSPGGSTKIIIALLSNLGIALAKFVGAFVSGSASFDLPVDLPVDLPPI